MRPHFSDIKTHFPVTAHPFKMSLAKAIANTPQPTPIGCCRTLGRIIPKTLSL